MKHRLSTAADVDLEHVARWYEEADGLGDEFIEEFLRFVSIIEANPQGFSRAPRCPKGREIRVVKIGQFDYLLYHEVLATEVVTIAIQHARRKSLVWRKRTP
jgi:plasmid stabilization system protein ParE